MRVGASDFLSNLGEVQKRQQEEAARVRWFYFLGYYPQKKQWGGWAGPFYVTNSQAFKIQEDAKVGYPGLTHYRLVYSPVQGVWVWDLRSDAELMTSSEPIPGFDTRVAGSRVGTTPVSPPVKGHWPFAGFPDVVQLMGGTFRKTKWNWPRPGVVMQYREALPHDSRHLFVLRSGTYVVSHRDEVNPDLASPAEHFIRDVMKRPDPMSPLEASLRAKNPEV